MPAWKAFFDKYGIVVIRDVLSASECERTVDDMWDSLASLGMHRDNPLTWDRMPWGAHLGFSGNHAVFTPSGKACVPKFWTH